MTRFRAMTLVELLVALSLLVAASSLTALLWGQMKRWSEEAASLSGSLRPARAEAFLREQWANRRAIVPVARDSRDCAAINSDRFEFVTTSPALFPGWPIVRAAYVIERDPGAPVRLVYEETRVVRLDGFGEGAGGVDSNGDPISRRIVVLEGCRELRWEVWTPSSPAVSTSVGQTSSDVGAAQRWAWRSLDAQSVSIGELAAAATPEKDQAETGLFARESERESAAEPSEARVREEQERTRREAARPKAVRLKGTRDEKEFAWSLIVEALRS